MRLLAGKEALTAPILFEVRNGTMTTLQDALAKGGNVNAKNDDGLTALLYVAAVSGSTETIELLLRAGADTNVRLPGRPLRMDVVKSGVAFRMVDKAWTPLMLASANADETAVRALLAGGADINAQDDEGATPLILAVTATPPRQPGVQPTREDIARDFLRQAGQSLDSVITRTVQALIAAGADVNRKTRTGSTALSAANRVGDRRVIELLQQAGAQ